MKRSKKKIERQLNQEFEKSMSLISIFPVDKMTEEIMVERSPLKCFPLFCEMVREAVVMINLAFQMGQESEDEERRKVYQDFLSNDLRKCTKKGWGPSLAEVVHCAYEAGQQTWKPGKEKS